MIKINLLPAESGKKTKAIADAGPPASAFAILLSVLGLAILGIAFYGYNAYSKVSERNRDLDATEARREKRRTDLAKAEAEYEQYARRSEEVEEKYAVVQGLSPENRVFWSEKLNMLARARFDLAVYITELNLTEKITELETEESVARRKAWEARKEKKPGEQPPKPIKRPVINQTLQIEAIAYGEDSPQRLRQVTLFDDNLKQLAWTRENGKSARFLDGVKSEFIQRKQNLIIYGGVEVLEFGFSVQAEPQMDRTPTTSPATLRTQVSDGRTTGAAGGQRRGQQRPNAARAGGNTK